MNQWETIYFKEDMDDECLMGVIYSCDVIEQMPYKTGYLLRNTQHVITDKDTHKKFSNLIYISEVAKK